MFFTIAQARPPDMIDALTSLGAAGVMGAMWLWERRTSRCREQQLDESHARIVADKVALDQLINIIRQNTEALARLAVTQEQLIRHLVYPRAASGARPAASAMT